MDVAAWRNYGLLCRPLTDNVYFIYVPDYLSGQVYCFDVVNDMNNNSYTDVFGDEYLSYPQGLTVDFHGDVWIASTGNHRIYRFSPDGVPHSKYGQDFFIEDENRSFYDVEVIGSDGVYAVDQTTGRGALLSYSFDGELREIYGEDILQCPESVAFNFGIDLDSLVETLPIVNNDMMKEGFGVSTTVTNAEPVEATNVDWSNTFDDAESDWASLEITISRNRAVNIPLLKFIKSHPNIFPLLQRILQGLGLS
jgi:hypothetical protein